ncbi:MAG: extracellular solute-binding protein [Christensenellales bacterium]|jgi:putative aldouronate transport system substrate-binding protein
MKKSLSFLLALLMLTFMIGAMTANAEDTSSFTIAVLRHALDKSESWAEKAGPINAEKITGVKINYNDIDASMATERINIMFASGDMPDAFISMLNEAIVTKNTASLVPLNDLLEEHAPNITAMFEKYPNLREMTTMSDGNIYTLPIGDYSNPDNQGEGIQFINKAWLDKLGLDVPKTTDEYYEVLKAVKNKDPNGNGLADELPITFCQNNWAAHFINFLGPWGIVEWTGGGDGYLKVVDNKAIFTPVLPEFRAGLEFYAKLAAEGLLDVEGFTQTNQQFYARLKEKVAITYRGWTPASNFDAETAAEFIALPPLQASDYPEIESLTPGQINKFCGNRFGFGITTACNDPAALLRWYDEQSKDAVTKMLWKYGEEGILWEQDENGAIWAIYPEQTEDFTRENMKYTYGNVNHIPCLVLPEELEQNDPNKYPEAVVRFGFVDVVKDHFPKERIPIRSVPEEKIAERDFLYTDLKAYLDGFVADSVVNGIDDARWEEHLRLVDQYGAKEWTQWYQDYLDGVF